ncbi:MAG: hypothetical protein M1833_004745 [Piccolia ochrophora]|nr:MAG: hypothetical protein M1833_004745 [Piccolia ochrophora]
MRLPLVHTTLMFGTNLTDTASSLSPQEIYQREVGSKMVLPERLFYATFLWMQKGVLLSIYRDLMKQLPWELLAHRTYATVFFLTLLMVYITTFTDCSPFANYWRVSPDPDQWKCAKAHVQIVTMGVLNILTDLMLIALPLPVLVRAKLTDFQFYHLLLLFSLGFFVVAVTAARLVQSYDDPTSLTSRYAWFSAETLAATIVCQGPMIYTLLRKKSTPTPSSYPSTNMSGPTMTNTTMERVERSTSERSLDKGQILVESNGRESV